MKNMGRAASINGHANTRDHQDKNVIKDEDNVGEEIRAEEKKSVTKSASRCKTVDDASARNKEISLTAALRRRGGFSKALGNDIAHLSGARKRQTLGQDSAKKKIKIENESDGDPIMETGKAEAQKDASGTEKTSGTERKRRARNANEAKERGSKDRA